MCKTLTVNNIKNTLISAMDKTYCDLEFFTGKLNNYYFPEYLLTCNIAEQIKTDYLDSPGHPYKIILEEKTSDFARACVPLIGEDKNNNDSVFGKMIISSPKNTKRNGKIDISVYQDDNAVCCIEVKGNSPTNEEIDKDLKRMSELFQIKDKTGANTLQLAILPFVYDVTKYWYSKKESLFKTKEKLAKENTNQNVKWTFVKLKKRENAFQNCPDEDYTENSYKYLYYAYIGLPISQQNINPMLSNHSEN